MNKLTGKRTFQHFMDSIPVTETTAPIRLAVFDFDGTLCALNSYRALLGERLRSGLRSCMRIAPAVVLRQTGLLSSSALKNRLLDEFRGWSRARLNQLGESLYDSRLRPCLIPPAIAELRIRREKGFQLVVVSGAFDFLLAPFCAEHGITLYGCSQVGFDGDTCTGRIQGSEMLGETKRRFLARQFSRTPVDWDQSYAYSDELTDLPLLAMVGNPCFINGPDSMVVTHPRLRRLDWQ